MALGLPDIGTGSLYYSQYDSNIVDLLSRIYDNNTNAIVAKDVRDSIWSLYNDILLIATQSLTQSQNYYTLGTPSTIDVGGITVGSTFSNISFQNFFDQMLLPYVAPAVNSFNPSITELQFGQSTPINLNYSIEVGSVPLSVINFTGPYLPIISDGGPFSSNPFIGNRTSIVPTYSTTVAVTQTNTFTMSVVTTDLLSFTTSTSLTYKHKRYYGPLTIPGGFIPSSPASVLAVQTFLTDSVIKGLSYSELSNNVNISQAMAFSNQYLVFAAPTVFGFNYPNGFFIDNIFSQDFTKIKSGVTFSNEYSYQAPYDVWVSNVPLSGDALVSTIPLSIGNTSSIYSVIIGNQGPQGATGPSELVIDSTPITSGNSNRILFESASNVVSESEYLQFNSSNNKFAVGIPNYYGATGNSGWTSSIQLSTSATYSFRLNDDAGHSLISAFKGSNSRSAEVYINESNFDGVFSIGSTLTVFGTGYNKTTNHIFRLIDSNTNDILGVRSDGRFWFGLFANLTANYTSFVTYYLPDGLQSGVKISSTTTSNTSLVVNNFYNGDVFKVSNAGTTSVVDLAISNSINVSSGLNKSVGTVSLVSGSASVTNSLSKTSSIILLTKQESGTINSSYPITVQPSNGSFIINSSNSLDTDLVGYMIINTF